METGNPFFSWLAAQPAFVEVGLGMMFCLVIAPVLLAVVAAGLTTVEQSLGRVLSQSGLLTPAAGPAFRSKWEPLRDALLQELPSLRKALSKRHA
jgi:hypothetical protein